MRHLFRMFHWIDVRYSPDEPTKRYRKQQTLGQDDYGRAVPYSGGIYFH